MTKKYRYTLISFIGLTMAMIANVRSVPMIAATGWQQLVYMAFASLCFALPLCLIAGEFGTTFPGNGGPQLWTKNGLGHKWGFVVAWLSWAQMFPGLIMASSTLGPLIGQALGQQALITSHSFALICILIATWVITLCSLKWNVARLSGNYGVWIGVYIPAAMLLILGIAATLKTGINQHSYLGVFSWHKLCGNIFNLKSLSYYGAIVFTFAGLEMTSVYIPQLKDANHNYLRGIAISLGFLIFLNTLNGLMTSNAIPQGQIQLANVSQPIAIYCHILHLPSWLANIFGLCVAIGIILQIASWVNGPCHTITQVAREGLLPAKWHFHQTNQYDISKPLLWTQIVILTLFALIYGCARNVNAIFLTLTNATSVIYMTVYAIMALALIKLRYRQPHLKRPFHIGGQNQRNGWAWLTCGALWLAVITVFIAIIVTNSLMNDLLVLSIACIMIAIPLIICHYHNPQWLQQVEDDLSQY